MGVHWIDKWGFENMNPSTETVQSLVNLQTFQDWLETFRLTLLLDPGAGSSSGASDSSLWRKLMHSHDFVHDRLTKLRVENSSEPQNGYSPIASPESAESPRKRGKLSRSSSNGTSRRTKLILLDDTVSTPRDNFTKVICGQGSTTYLGNSQPTTV